MKEFVRRNLFGIIGILISIFIITLFCLKQSNFEDLVSITLSTNKKWLSFAVFSMVFYVVLESLSLFILEKHIWKDYRYKYAFKVSCLGLFYNAVTPFATGGQPMQLYTMTQYGKNFGEAGAIITVKSIIYQICLTVCSIVAIFISFQIFHGKVAHFVLFISIGLLINIVAVFLMVMLLVNVKFTQGILIAIIKFLHKIHIIKNVENSVGKLQIQISLYRESGKLFKSATKTLIGSYCISSLQFIFYYYISYCIYRSFGLSGTPVIIMISAQAIITMITAFIPLPGGSLAAEGSFYLFFALFFTPATILPAIFLWRFITYYSVIIFGGLASIKVRNA